MAKNGAARDKTLSVLNRASLSLALFLSPQSIDLLLAISLREPEIPNTDTEHLTHRMTDHFPPH